MNFIILFLVLLGNLWIWKIFSLSVVVGFLVLATSFFLYLSLIRSNKSYLLIFSLMLVTLLILQWQKTTPVDLVNLNNDEQRVQQARLKEYPPLYIKFGEKTFWIPIAHWFEGRKEIIAAFRMLNNLSTTVNPNLYFFANHPQERIGKIEFEMFPYILLPFFFYGIILLIGGKSKKIIWLSFILPIALIILIANDNPFGPLSLFPFVSVMIVRGLEGGYKKISKKYQTYRQLFVVGFLMIFILVFLQIIAYASY